MAQSVSSYCTLYRFTPGRRAWMLRMIAERARRLGFDEVAARCEALLAEERALASDMQAWTVARARVAARKSSQRLGELDQARDRVGAGFSKYLKAQAFFAGSGGETGKLGEAAQRLLDGLFPDGVAAVIRSAYVDETATLGALVDRLRGPLWSDVQATKSEVWVDALEAANAAFDEEYDRLTGTAAGDWATLRTRDAEAQEAFVALVAAVIGAAYGTPHLEALLEPVEIQQAALKKLYQRRRSVPDVDPETGEALPGEPSAASPQAAAPSEEAAPSDGEA